MDNKQKIWVTVIATMMMVIGGLTIVLQPESFEIQLSDGTVKAQYRAGQFKSYEGRYVAYEDDIRPYYYNSDRRSYITMYKSSKCGFGRYSDIRYNNSIDSLFVAQDVCFSQGVLTRYFEINEYNVKKSFEWRPFESDTRVYFRWNFDELDEWADRVVYVDSGKKLERAEMDFDIVNDWGDEIDNIVRAERFQNGRLTIRTRVYEGNAFFDPDIILNDAKYELQIADFKKLKYDKGNEFIVEHKGYTMNISADKNVDIKVNEKSGLYGRLQYEWAYVYDYDGTHPEIDVTCNVNVTEADGKYYCGMIELDMSTVESDVNMSGFTELNLGQPDKIKFRKDVTRVDNKLGVKLETVDTPLKLGDKSVIDPIITLLEADVFGNSTLVNATLEGTEYIHIDINTGESS